MPNFVEVLKIDQLEKSQDTTVFLNECNVALYKYEGNFDALDKICVHHQGRCSDGFSDA